MIQVKKQKQFTFQFIAQWWLLASNGKGQDNESANKANVEKRKIGKSKQRHDTMRSEMIKLKDSLFHMDRGDSKKAVEACESFSSNRQN